MSLIDFINEEYNNEYKLIDNKFYLKKNANNFNKNLIIEIIDRFCKDYGVDNENLPKVVVDSDKIELNFIEETGEKSIKTINSELNAKDDKDQDFIKFLRLQGRFCPNKSTIVINYKTR